MISAIHGNWACSLYGSVRLCACLTNNMRPLHLDLCPIQQPLRCKQLAVVCRFPSCPRMCVLSFRMVSRYEPTAKGYVTSRVGFLSPAKVLFLLRTSHRHTPDLKCTWLFSLVDVRPVHIFALDDKPVRTVTLSSSLYICDAFVPVCRQLSFSSMPKLNETCQAAPIKLSIPLSLSRSTERPKRD